MGIYVLILLVDFHVYIVPSWDADFKFKLCYLDYKELIYPLRSNVQCNDNKIILKIPGLKH